MGRWWDVFGDRYLTVECTSGLASREEMEKRTNIQKLLTTTTTIKLMEMIIRKSHMVKCIKESCMSVKNGKRGIRGSVGKW